MTMTINLEVTLLVVKAILTAYCVLSNCDMLLSLASVFIGKGKSVCKVYPIATAVVILALNTTFFFLVYQGIKFVLTAFVQ